MGTGEQRGTRAVKPREGYHVNNVTSSEEIVVVRRAHFRCRSYDAEFATLLRLFSRADLLVQNNMSEDSP